MGPEDSPLRRRVTDEMLAERMAEQERREKTNSQDFFLAIGSTEWKKREEKLRQMRQVAKDKAKAYANELKRMKTLPAEEPSEYFLAIVYRREIARRIDERIKQRTSGI